MACASNLRQFGQQFQLYANENGGWTPPQAVSPGNPANPLGTYSWWQFVALQMDKAVGVRGQEARVSTPDPWANATRETGGGLPNNLGIFRCPANDIQKFYGDWWNYTIVVARNPIHEETTSYNINGNVDWWYNSKIVNSGWRYDNLDGQFTSMKYSMMSSPSELIAMADGTGGHFKATQHSEWSDPGQMRSVPAPDPYWRTPVYNDRGVAFMRYVHNQGYNILYADGHVEWQKGALKWTGSRYTQLDPPARFDSAGNKIAGDTNYAHYYPNGKMWFARN